MNRLVTEGMGTEKKGLAPGSHTYDRPYSQGIKSPMLRNGHMQVDLDLVEPNISVIK